MWKLYNFSYIFYNFFISVKGIIKCVNSNMLHFSFIYKYVYKFELYDTLTILLELTLTPCFLRNPEY